MASQASSCYVCTEELDEPALVILTKHGFVAVHPRACRYALNAIDTPSIYEQHVRGEYDPKPRAPR